MYLKHFGLERSPFKITPDTSLFYEGGNRGAALEAVKYAILQGEGIIKVVGEVGSGKTMLCRMLEIKLPDHVEIVYLANPSLSPERILHVIAMEMKLPVEQSDDKSKVMQLLQNYLLDRHAKGRQVVVFIEEAQGMPLETLEEIRLLSNLETDQYKLLQIVLFGQPELDENLAKRQIRQLKERITHHFSLDMFDKHDIQSYLNFRLRAAGYKGADLFNTRLAAIIAKYSNGLTRRINILADKALLGAFAESSDAIKSHHIKLAAKDSQYTDGGLNKAIRNLLLVIAVVLAVSAGWFLRSLDSDSQLHDSSKVVNKENIASIENNSNFPDRLAGEIAKKQLPFTQDELFISRVQAAESQLVATDGFQYSIQLMLVDDEPDESLGRYLGKLQANNMIAQTYIAPAVVNQKKVFNVVFGQYRSYADAAQSMNELPAEIKKARPFIRSISGIKKEMLESKQ